MLPVQDKSCTCRYRQQAQAEEVHHDCLLRHTIRGCKTILELHTLDGRHYSVDWTTGLDCWTHGKCLQRVK